MANKKQKQREQSRNKMLKKNHGFGTAPEEKQKMSIRYTVRGGPFVKSL